ncbi:MAG: hypothetical protein Q9227_006794 [Pyrenula ochraceoflavens]
MAASAVPAPPSSSATTASTQPINIKIGTRKSNLALVQANTVSDLLRASWSDPNAYTFEICGHNTAAGDIDKVTPFKDMPVKNIWTHELERMLVDGELALLVHSLKAKPFNPKYPDVPTQLPPPCTLAAVPPRSDPRDAFVPKLPSSPSTTTTSTPTIRRLSDLPPNAVVGTSSIRRTAQLKLKYPHLTIKDCRGNIGTRLSKLNSDSGGFDALILAAAGLLRLGLEGRITQYLSSKEGGMLYAVGQGAMGVEIRSGDAEVEKLVGKVNAWRDWLACLAERALLRWLEGGCSAPLGVETEWKNDGEEEVMVLRAVVVSPDGRESVEVEREGSVGSVEEAEGFGVEVGKELVGKGAGRILEEIKERKRPTEVTEL